LITGVLDQNARIPILQVKLVRLEHQINLVLLAPVRIRVKINIFKLARAVVQIASVLVRVVWAGQIKRAISRREQVRVLVALAALKRIYDERFFVRADIDSFRAWHTLVRERQIIAVVLARV
jgi:hypothetical protein